MLDRYTDKINFKQGMPSLEDLNESRDAFLVLDDLMFANSEFLSKIYTPIASTPITFISVFS